MSEIPFCGPSYRDRSIKFDAQRSINLYMVKSEIGNSKSAVALAATPGLKAFTTLPLFPIRGCHDVNSRVFFVGGNKLYEVFIDATFMERGQLNTSTGNVSISDNGTQVIVVDGPNGYIYSLADNSFTLITSPGFLGADTVTFLDGYFVLNKPQSQIYFISALYDGLTYDPLDFASAEGSPDNLVGVITIRREVWLFGTSTVQVVYNSGGADFPLAPIQGAFIEYGASAPQSIAKSANSLFWVGSDSDGNGIVFMANGYAPQRISTYAVEYAIQQYNTLSDAVGYTYQEDGHYFYVINFPTANTTWVYDVTESQWHERAYFTAGHFQRHRAQCHVFAYDKHLVGDYENGIIYIQSRNYYSDNGQEIRRERITPHLANDLKRIKYNAFQIDMQVGIGTDGVTTPSTDPQVMMQFSDDGGYTWSSERWVSAGRIGKYRARARWRQLGQGRDRVFKVALTVSCPIMLIAGFSEFERLAS